jgi:hypothetical protein
VVRRLLLLERLIGAARVDRQRNADRDGCQSTARRDGPAPPAPGDLAVHASKH